MSKPYRIIDTEDRDEWLTARQNVLTATDIARLHTGGAGTWATIRAEKAGQRNDFDNRYMQWGREREPVLNEYARMFVDSTLTPNDKLLVSTDDPRIGATPDMLGDDVINEDKTSKFPMPDMSAGLNLTGTALKYYVQVQVQLMVTGADACVFVWEQHDDEWPNPLPLTIDHQIIRPDKEAFAAIRGIVDRYHGESNEDNAEVARYVHELRKLDYEKKQLELREKEVKGILRGMVGEGGKVVVPDGAVSITTPTVRKSFDSTKFKKHDPELFEQFVVEKKIAPVMRVTFAKDDDE